MFLFIFLKKNTSGVLIFLLIFKMGVVLLRMHKEDNRRTDEAQRKTWFESQPKSKWEWEALTDRKTERQRHSSEYDWAQPEDTGHSNSVLLKSLQGLSSNVTAIIGSEPSKRMGLPCYAILQWAVFSEKLEDVAKNPRGFFNSFYKSMNKTVWFYVTMTGSVAK